MTALAKTCRDIAPLLLCLAAASLLRSDDRAARSDVNDLRLFPSPQEIEATSQGQRFALSDDVLIALCDEATEEDEFAAKDLREGIKEAAGLSLQINFGIPKDRAILLGIPKRDKELAGVCKQIGIEVDPRIGDEGYVLAVNRDRVVLLANSSAGLFYGAQTLRQLVDPASKTIPCVTIRDWPDLPQRWVMYDVGRFQTIDLKYCRRIIESLARAKTNGLMFYMEDDYKFREYPFLGREGTFTRAKAARLVELAKQYHVQIIPHFQSLGHMYGVLRHEQMADIREQENGEVVCPLAPRTLEFFDDVYGELCDAFSNTEFFHVGGDEFESGFARCKRCAAEAERIGRTGLYARHMNSLHSLLKKRGRTMICRPSHGEGDKDYRDPAHTVERSLTLQPAGEMPKDIVIFEWDYSGADDYPTVKFYQDAGFTRIMVCSEVKGGLTLYPNVQASFDNSKRLFGFAKDHKLMGGCVCTWSLYRGGLFETSWPGLLYAAQCAWSNAKADPKDFARTFALRWFGIPPGQDDVADDVETVFHFPHMKPPGRRFWRTGWTAPEIFFGRAKELRRYVRMFVEADVQKESRELLDVAEEALAAVDRLKGKAKRNLLTLDFIESSILNYRHVARKCLILEEAARAYREAAAVQGDEGLKHLRRAMHAMEDLKGDYPYIVRMFRRAADECGGRKEDVIYGADQDEWARKTNEIRHITPVMDLQQETEGILAALEAAMSKARAGELLDPPRELGFEELSEAKIGMWTGADVSPSDRNDHRLLTYEVTKQLDEKVPYEVIYDHYKGPDGICIVSTGLYVSSFPGDIGRDRMTRVAEDIHDGFAGEQDKDNIYLLEPIRYDGRLRYFVVGEVYSNRNADNCGVIWFRKKRLQKEPPPEPPKKEQGKGEKKKPGTEPKKEPKRER